jgi:uncharacterized coiled-coil protein SlyX
MEEQAPKKKMYRLNFEQKFVLSEWLRNNVERIMSELPRTGQVAKEATEALGFEVHSNSIVEVCRVCKIVWEPRSLHGKPGHKRWDVVRGRMEEIEAILARQTVALQEMEKKSRKQQAEIDSLRGLVNTLYQQLEVTDPTGQVPPVPPVQRKLIDTNHR